jgi:NDP-sugar pyrophosphorylase family protein
MNGDLLTTLQYGDMWRYHKERGAIATLAIYQRKVEIDLGVIETDTDNWVTKYVEKPTFHYTVSTGIYIFEPAILNYIEPSQRLDLPELVLRLLERGEKVSSYRYAGYWLDIGRVDDYQEAIQKFETHRQEFLPTR